MSSKNLYYAKSNLKPQAKNYSVLNPNVERNKNPVKFIWIKLRVIWKSKQGLLLYVKIKSSEGQNLVKFAPNNDAKDWKGAEDDS